jgi:hypothetical protein
MPPDRDGIHSEGVTDYPCPTCGARADLTDGCSGCHLPPDPVAAEVVSLAATIAGLNTEVEEARSRYTAVLQRRGAAIERHNELVGQIRARTSAPPAAPVAPPERPVLPPARPESSGRTVQNLLFVLGGLLLGSAAIVFAAVAWATVGVPGRAVILAAVTVLVLAVPPVALRRRLTGTAETFAALGLLLVLLDGYAAWAVNLFDVTAVLGPDRYAAAVCAVTAAVALGYRRLTRLAGPGYAALALIQPVPGLALTATGLGPAGWSATLGTLALADVAAARWSRPRELRILAWVFAVAAAAGALGYAVVGGLVGADVAGAARAGAALVLVALVPVAAALANPGRSWLRELAGAGLVWALLLGAGRVLALTLPDLRLAPHAAELAVLALGVRLLPARLRGGPRLGVLTAAGLVAVLPVLLALSAAWSTVSVAWTGDLGATAGHVDWWVPATLALLAVAVALLVPPVVPAVVGLVLVALALPRAAPLAWWAPSIVDGVAAVPLVLAAARVRRWAAVCGTGALLLLGHAATVGLAGPGVSAAVLGGVLGLAVLCALLAGPVPAIRAVAVGIALAVPAGLGAALAATGGLPAAPYAIGGLVLSTGAVFVLREPGLLAVPLAGLGVLWGTFGARWYVAVPALCDVLVGVAMLPRRRRYLAGYLVLGIPAPLFAVVTALPATWSLLVGPYRWLSAIWSGAPAGTGVGEPAGWPFGYGPVAVGQAVLTLATVAALYRLRQALAWAAVPGAIAVVAGTAAVGAPWPVVAAVTLGLGLVVALWTALRPQPWLGLLALPLTGAGVAGMLPVKGSTLAGLAAVLVTAVVCGAAGRVPAVRVAGWLGAVVSGALLAFASARSLELSLHTSALWVLAVAAAGLALSTRTGRAVEAAAHGTAGAALLLTLGAARYPALVLGLWGVALGLRALWPGEPVPARRVRVVAGVVCELVAYWLLLWTGGVTLVEAYTVPVAGVALLAGWLAARTRPALHSWTAYGPALLAGFGPSLALVLAVPGEPLRRLVLGLAAVAVVVAGSVRRRQAPVVVGGTCLAVLAAHEAVLLWDLLPRWIPLGAAGLLLVGLAVTYERRRRDLDRLRTAVGRMG